MKLYELTGAILELQERLDNADNDDTKQCILDTLESIHYSLEDKTEGIVKLVQNTNSDISAIDTEISRLQRIKKVKTNSVNNLKEYLKNNLIALNKKNVKTSLFNVTIGAGRDKIVIEDELKVPIDYLRFKQEVDKTALTEALKDPKLAEELNKEGIRFEKTPNLIIK